MPAVSTNSNSKVLVTGANGYLALWIVRVLLEQGFIVRGTVRSEDKGNKLKQIFSTYGDKLEWVVVPDIVAEGAFDKALEDIDAVVHSASPVAVESEDPDAAWDTYEKHKSEIGWELVVLNPSIVIGKPVQDFDTPAEAPHSVQLWYNHIVELPDEEGVNGTFIYVDIRDVAEAHMLSITKEAAGGERFVLSAGSAIYQKMRDVVFSLRPDYYSSGLLPRGNPDVQGEPLIPTTTTKAEDILGFKYRSLEETIENTLAGYEAKGLIGKK